MIIEIAARGKGCAGTGQDRRRHLLGAGLAVTAGDANHRDVEASAPVLRRAREGRLALRDDHADGAGAGHGSDRGFPAEQPRPGAFGGDQSATRLLDCFQRGGQ